ncbi:hypothetical protein RhiirA5_298009 [Rhizophagus irregularis]|uniref:Fet5p n=1 Tax=Rhizophagus irregularis TaxID=588596 RepID=A0A2N0P4Z7_9GLOM|nr:hypothetical protein RhiirA5_298009 [Rhizophagus irregularis]
MKLNLKKVLILFISLFVICSSAIPARIHNVDNDEHLHLRAYTNEIQKRHEPFKIIQTDYFKPFVHLPFTNKPVTRYYQLTLKKVKLSPDGFERTVWSVNGQYPAPIIRANKGDRMIINVENKFGDPAAVHWHGVFQHGTNWYDGVPGQTQCPIPNDVSFIYNFTTGDQHGTFWYHSHFMAQYADGLRGALIVHDPDDPYLKEYDYEYVITLSDWHHRTTGEILPNFISPTYTGKRPVPDSPLLSGRGRYNFYNVKKNKKYRFRIINSAADAFFIFSIDEHKLKLIESEGIYIKPTIIEKLPINVGQRYSVIVNADQPIGKYWIRATIDKRCVLINNATINFNSSIDWNGLGILKYEGSKNDKPKSKEFPENFKICRDPDPKHLKPLQPVTKYDGNISDFFNITVKFQREGDGIVKAVMNNSSFIPQFNDPTINKIIRHIPPDELPKEQNSLIFDNKNGIVEIALWNNNTDEHPFHMHGHVFGVMFVGEKNEYPDEKKYDKKNPVIRDNVTVPGFGYLVIRFIADNPGIWAFHCHIEWHVELGMVLQLVELPSILMNETIPNDASSLCFKNDYQKKRNPTTPFHNRERMFNPVIINEIRRDINKIR